MEENTINCRNLPYFLERQGLSRCELERQCQLEKETLSVYCDENGHNMPLEIAEKVAAVLRVNIKELSLRLPCKNLKYYCDERNLTRYALEKKCKMRTNLLNAYNEDQDTMALNKISKVAEALCVDIEDLGAPEEERVPIKKITEEILDTFVNTGFPVILSQTKAEMIVSHFLRNSLEGDILSSINYLIIDSNTLGRSLARFVLTSPDQKSGKSQSNFSTEFREYFNKRKKHNEFDNDKNIIKFIKEIEKISGLPIEILEKYAENLQEPRLFSLDALAYELNISRQTLNTDLKEEKKKKENRKHDERIDKIKSIFNIESILPMQDAYPTLIPKEQLIKDISLAIAQTKPRSLNTQKDLILAYLKRKDGNMEYLLNCLFDPTSAKQAKTIDILQDMMKHSIFRRKRYKPQIQVRYYQTDPGWYDVAILFNVDQLNKNLAFFNLLKDLLSNEDLMQRIQSDENFIDELLTALEKPLSQLDADFPSLKEDVKESKKDFTFETYLIKYILLHRTLSDMSSPDDLSLKKDFLNEILLRGTIYPLLQLPSPFQFFLSSDTSALPQADWNYPYQLEINSSPDDDAFEQELLESAIQTYMEDVEESLSSEVYPCLADILSDYLEQHFQHAEVVKDIVKDLNL